MTSSDQTQATRTAALRPGCSLCGQQLGVYEPAIFVVDGVPHRSSRAAGAELAAAAELIYHPACYELRGSGT